MGSQKAMRPRGYRLWFVALVLVLTALAHTPQEGVAAPLPQEMVLNITYPPEGTVLSGQVTIQGTATHPNFYSYGLLYASGSRVTADTSWRLDDPIAWDMRTMVVNGVLGTWDTTKVPNGPYVLALVVYENGNDTPFVHFVNNLMVQNEEATPTPEVEATATPEEGTGVIEPETGGTLPPPPTIQQPPTATPRPTPTLVVETPSTGEDDEAASPTGHEILSVSAVKEAFVTGVQLAILLYVLGILYTASKAVIRHYLRQLRKGTKS